MPTCSSPWSPRPATSASTVEIKALHGDPATVLAELATVREASQIFIGRNGHSRVRELLFGSTLLSLAKRPRCR